MYWSYDRESVEREWPDVRCFPSDTAEQRQFLIELIQSDRRIRVVYGYGPPGDSPFSLAQMLWRGNVNGVFANLKPVAEAFSFLDEVRLELLRCRAEDEAKASDFHKFLIEEFPTHDMDRVRMRVTDELCG